MASKNAKGGMWLRRSNGKRTLVTQSQGGGLPSGDSEAEIADKLYAERKANADKIGRAHV